MIPPNHANYARVKQVVAEFLDYLHKVRLCCAVFEVIIISHSVLTYCFKTINQFTNNLMMEGASLIQGIVKYLYKSFLAPDAG